MENLLKTINSFSESLGGRVEPRAKSATKEFIKRFDEGERAVNWIPFEDELKETRNTLRIVHDSLYAAESKEDQAAILDRMAYLRFEIQNLEERIASAREFVRHAEQAKAWARTKTREYKLSDDQIEIMNWSYVASSAQSVLDEAFIIFEEERARKSPQSSQGSIELNFDPSDNHNLGRQSQDKNKRRCKSVPLPASSHDFEKEDGIPSMERMLSTLPRLQGISDDSLLNDSFSETSDVADLLAAPTAFLPDEDDDIVVDDHDEEDDGRFHQYASNCSSSCTRILCDSLDESINQ